MQVGPVAGRPAGGAAQRCGPAYSAAVSQIICGGATVETRAAGGGGGGATARSGASGGSGGAVSRLLAPAGAHLAPAVTRQMLQTTKW
jgi:hypothetical protein